MINPWFIFVYVLVIGACIGSFLNVVVYRMPLGKSLWHPPSTCPGCDQRIKIYDNIPILGWILLRGRCRNCKSHISIEYPLVETLTMLLLGGVFAALYFGEWRPGFMGTNLGTTWLPLIVYLVLTAALLAATLIDARHFIIPLGIPYFALVVAVIFLPMAEMFWPGCMLNDVLLISPPCGRAATWNTGIGPAIVDPMWIGVAAGGLVGLLIANGLLMAGKLPRGFADEDEYCPSCTHHWGPDFEGKKCPECGWDVPQFEGPAKGGFAAKLGGGGKEGGDGKEGKEGKGNKKSKAPKSLRFTKDAPPPKKPPVTQASAGSGDSNDGGSGNNSDDEEILWVQHPHARREALKECLFLLFPVVGMIAGAMIMPKLLPVPLPSSPPPMHPSIHVLAGMTLGFLVGGGIVWATRVLGTLGFGKEAMGLGDVHLLAAIGAILGSGDVVVAFFIAPFFGLLFVAIGAVISRLKNRSARVIPYGPYLAFASLLMMVFHEPIAKIMCERFGILIRM